MKIKPIGQIKYVHVGLANRVGLVNNHSLLSAIRGKSGSILKDPYLGFVVGNIKVATFMLESFVFSLENNGISRLGGRALVRLWGKDPKTPFNEGTILKTLRWLGLEIEGEDVIKALEADFNKNSYMKQAIENGRTFILRDGSRGFQENNIDQAEFMKGMFQFRDRAGILRKFCGATLMRKRGYTSLTKDNLFLLLKEIGISVQTEVQSPSYYFLSRPSPEEYTNNALMLKAIQSGQHQFSTDPFDFTSFLRAVFSIEINGLTKTFSGKDFLAARGGRTRGRNRAVAFLRIIGMRVNAGPKARVLPQPKQYLSDDDFIVPIMRAYVRKNRKVVLIDPLRGFEASNIIWWRMIDSSRFIAEYKGARVTFDLKKLLHQRGYLNNAEGISRLLKALEIN